MPEPTNDNARIVREALDRMTTTRLDTARAKAEAIDALYDLSSELAAYKRLTKELEGEDIKLRVALATAKADLERAREALKEWAAEPCEMPGPEDMEGGCCRSCRTRAALAPEQKG